MPDIVFHSEEMRISMVWLFLLKELVLNKVIDILNPALLLNDFILRFTLCNFFSGANLIFILNTLRIGV